MLVRDLMQPEVATLDADDTLDLADDIMKLGRIRHLPVVECGKVVGILSERDLFRAAVSSLLHVGRRGEREWFAGVPVATVMTTTVVTVSPTTPIRTAVQLMLDARIGCLPVVEGDELVGLLGESDCLRHLAHVLDIAAEKRALGELPSL